MATVAAPQRIVAVAFLLLLPPPSRVCCPSNAYDSASNATPVESRHTTTSEQATRSVDEPELRTSRRRWRGLGSGA